MECFISWMPWEHIVQIFHLLVNQFEIMKESFEKVEHTFSPRNLLRSLFESHSVLVSTLCFPRRSLNEIAKRGFKKPIIDPEWQNHQVSWKFSKVCFWMEMIIWNVLENHTKRIWGVGGWWIWCFLQLDNENYSILLFIQSSNVSLFSL